MYEENNNGFTLKNTIFKLLLVILFVVLIIWLFPTKSYVNNVIDKKLGTSQEQVFNTNLNAMKEAALSYYSGSRLPQEKEKITLKEMLNKNLLIDFKDSKGNKCNVQKSYVEITKNKEDYTLKVNLNCTDKKGYIISYITYNDAGEVYEKKKLTEEETGETKKQEQTQTNPTSNSECEYTKTNNGYYTNYGNWSNWTTNVISKSNTRQVQTKQEKVQTGTTKEISGKTTQTKQATKIKTTVNGQTKYVYICPADYDNGGSYQTMTTCYKTITTYRNAATYKNVTYYRYRDRKYISGSKDTKWGSCNNSELLNNGYKQTGNTR